VLDFRILGPFEVLDGDRLVVLGGPKQRALVAVLLLRGGEADGLSGPSERTVASAA
jgi:DNA-binding SARP family transcriptional activator